MAGVPTVEELGVQDWFKDENKQQPTDLFSGPPVLSEREAENRKQEYTVLNGILMLAFVFPALFSKIIGQRFAFFQYFVYAMVHEAGHMIWGIFGWRFLTAAGGTLNEMLFSVVPALICLKEKETYPAAFVFLMCAGMSIQTAGWYMSSAAHPTGYAFGSGARLTAANDDWVEIYSDLGISFKDAYSNGVFFAAVGHAIAVIFFISAVGGFLAHMYDWDFKDPFMVVSPAAAVALCYFIYVGAEPSQPILAAALIVPRALKLISGAS